MNSLGELLGTSRPLTLARFLAVSLYFVVINFTAIHLPGTVAYATPVRSWTLSNPTPQPTCPTHPDPSCYWYGEGPLSNPTQQNQPRFLIKSIYSKYNQDQGTLLFRTVLGDNPAISGTVTPESFWMVLNHGPMPWVVGMSPMIYFDANNPDNPKLTAYGYSSGHALFDRSWEDGHGGESGIQAPDRICSSINSSTCPNWVQSLSVSDDVLSGDRTFEFIIDATPLVTHTPLYSAGSPWMGASSGQPARFFDEHLGIWFHVGLGRSFGYDPEGFITSVSEGPAAGYYDAEGLTTNDIPECLLTTQGSSPLACEGTTTSVEVTVSVPPDQDGDLVTRSYIATCLANGLPVPASVNEVGGVASVQTQAPGLGQETSCSLTLVVSDGFEEASCEAEFSVAPCSLDCLGTPLGASQIDRCGVCNGTNACLDCRNNPFGGATLDRCGVCAGDGMSCLGCTMQNSTSTLVALDSGAAEARGLALRALGRLKRTEGATRSFRRFREKVLSQASQFYSAAWIAAWDLPSTVVSCTNQSFCVSVSNEPALLRFEQSFNGLSSLVRDTVRRIQSINPGAGRGILRGLKKLEAEVAKARALVPPQQSVCSS